MTEPSSFHIGRGLPPAESISDLPDWKQAKPAWIEAERAYAVGEISGVSSHGEDHGEDHGDGHAEEGGHGDGGH